MNNIMILYEYTVPASTRTVVLRYRYEYQVCYGTPLFRYFLRRDPPTPPPDGSSFPIHKIIEPWLLTRSIAVHAVVVTTYPDIFVYIRTYGRERTGSRPASSGHRIAHATLCKQQHTRARILTAWAETRSPVVQTSPRSLERGAGSSGILRTTLSARGELAG